MDLTIYRLRYLVNPNAGTLSCKTTMETLTFAKKESVDCLPPLIFLIDYVSSILVNIVSKTVSVINLQILLNVNRQEEGLSISQPENMEYP